MKKAIFILTFMAAMSLSVSAQLVLPRESQRQEIAQTIGDTKVSIVYHRPSVKGRKVFDGLQPYGKVWRTGANENTTFEVSRDVMINGQPLPAGKYGLHSIPGKDEWILIFNKDNDDWGSFAYDEKKDALRVKVKPQVADFQETMAFEFGSMTMNTADVFIVWDKTRVPFTINAGDVAGRSLAVIREAIANRKADDFSPYNQGANYVLTFKLKPNYEEAIGWLDASLKARETFGSLAAKARILSEMGKTKEAIEIGDKAVAVGKVATPPANTTDLEKYLAEWKAKK